jgi:hypothetical protein
LLYALTSNKCCTQNTHTHTHTHTHHTHTYTRVFLCVYTRTYTRLNTHARTYMHKITYAPIRTHAAIDDWDCETGEGYNRWKGNRKSKCTFAPTINLCLHTQSRSHDDVLTFDNWPQTFSKLMRKQLRLLTNRSRNAVCALWV